MAKFSRRIRFWDHLIFALFTCSGYEPFERFELFKYFVDDFDPARERLHVILPLIASCPTMSDRHMMIFRCLNIGYKDIEELDSFVTSRMLLLPLMRSFDKMSDHEKLDRASHILNTFGVPLTSTWKIIP
ncbi:Protein C04E6.11 [Aphelenchoides avenae]|nr:Protein C04E6.11 [Aphelenchus avenae]